MSTELKVGDLIDGRYQVIAELGAGMSASVYSARDTQLDRTVAVKVLRQHAGAVWTDDRRERFVREAQALSQLSSPSLVQVHRIGLLDNGAPFIVRQVVDGKPLGNMLTEEKTLSSQTAATICAQIADALAVAHKSGIVHRDVKPDNIIVSMEDGKPVARLVDFGLSAFSADGQQEIMRLTMTGEILGTPTYMSPEQARGAKLDGRCDIYALGCVFFECITGRSPFANDDAMQVLWAHLNEPVPDLRTLYHDSSIPEQLVATVKRSLAKATEERYQRAEELAADLREIETLPALKLGTVVKFDPDAGAKKKKKALMWTLVALAASAASGLCLFGTTVLTSDDVGVQTVQTVGGQVSKNAAQDLGVWLVGEKRLLHGPAPAAQFAVQLVSATGVTGGLPENQLPFIMRCLQAIGPTEARSTFPLLLLLLDRAFYNVEGTGRPAPDVDFSAIRTATEALWPPNNLSEQQRVNSLTPKQWEELSHCLDRHYDAERDFVSNSKEPVLFSKMKELNALGQLNKGPVSEYAANEAARYYEQATLPYLHDMSADKEFDRLIKAGHAAEQKFDILNKRALLWRRECWRLVYKGKMEEARKLFQKVDAIPAFYWGLSGQESGDHGRLRDVLYGDGKSQPVSPK